MESVSTCSTEQELRPGFLFAAWQGSRAPSLTSMEGLVISDTSSQESRAEAVCSCWIPSIMRAPGPEQVPGRWRYEGMLSPPLLRSVHTANCSQLMGSLTLL